VSELESPDLPLRFDCDRPALALQLAARFAPLIDDGTARAFALRSLEAPSGRVRTLLYRVLRRSLSDFDAYGLLGMYPMHLLSRAQFADLLSTAAPAARPRRLLDVGAGNGDLTALAAEGFDDVYATESSRVLRGRLRARGFRVLAQDLEREAPTAARRFEAVLCLNVIDRCAHPITLIANLRAALAPEGRLLLSVPLPLSPHVQRGGETVDPEEPLPRPEPTFEAGATALAREVIEPAGLTIERICRAPYLCRGDAEHALYALDAAVFVCSA
jgi:SAM-dependent methyltransferase